MEEQNRSSRSSIVLAVVIAAIVVGGGMYWWQSTKVEVKTTTPTIEEGLQYSYDDPQWKTLASDIKAQTNEVVESFYAPKSPSNDDVIFISTSGGTGEWSDTIKSTNKIYSYNLKTGELSKMYEEEENRLLRTMGIEGTKLIVMYDLIDNSPGPCFSVWADWKNFGSLDVEDPSTLSPYTVPEYQIQKGKEEQKQCMNEMGF